MAKEVGKEFPDRKVAGYIYADYLYPPSTGVPALEPNLALVVAPSISYGYRLYRPDVQKEWDALMGAWGKLAGRADLYYYDLPTYLKQSNGLLLPPAPEILNFVYSRLSRYGYKGAYVYGSPIWPAAGPGNYALAQLNWNPAANAHRIVANYYRMAYGPAAPHVATMYQLVDSRLERYYQQHEDASYNLTPAYLPEVYAPIQAQLEAEFARALALELSPKQRRRLEQLGQVLALQQFNLRVNGALPAGYSSPLTWTQEKVDTFFGAARAGDILGPVLLPASPPLSRNVAPRLANPAAPWQAALDDQSLVPVRGAARLALYAPQAGNVELRMPTLDTRAEFAHFALSDAAGMELSAGVMSQGRTISFAARAGATYFLTLQNVWTSFRLQVRGALPAYQANFTSRGFRLELHEIPPQGLPLTVTVPAGMSGFSILISGRGALAEVLNPQGKKAGQIDTRQTTASRLVVPAGEAEPGIWTLRFAPAPTQEALLGYIVLDAKLPPWLGTTPAAPLLFDPSAP